MLLSALALAFGTVLMKRLRGLDVFSMQGWTALVSVLPLLAMSMVFEPGGFAQVQQASWVAWAGVAYAAFMSSLLGHGLYYVLIQRHPVAQVMPWLLLTPVLAVALGIAFWGDRPGPAMWIGG
ncbi:DMT family transporter, partial [Lysobacter sp. A3-1-A15]